MIKQSWQHYCEIMFICNTLIIINSVDACVQFTDVEEALIELIYRSISKSRHRDKWLGNVGKAIRTLTDCFFYVYFYFNWIVSLNNLWTLKPIQPICTINDNLMTFLVLSTFYCSLFSRAHARYCSSETNLENLVQPQFVREFYYFHSLFTKKKKYWISGFI